jgi:hypothetical protein
VPRLYHVLNNVAQRSRGLVLILSREEVQLWGSRARAAGEVRISQSRPDKSGGDGGGHGPVVQDAPAAQPGGGLRAAAGCSGRAHECLPAPAAAAVASGPPCPRGGHEGGGM